MDRKFFTDGTSVFKIQKAFVVLENVETQETEQAECLDGGSLVGFSPVELTAPTTRKINAGRPKKALDDSPNPRKKVGSSRFTGVRQAKGHSSFQANAYYDGKLHYLGSFPSEEEAARKVDEERVKHGLAKVNFP
jgi:hypothetical protein